MEDKFKGISLVIICTLINSIAQVFYKFGANNLELSLTGIIYNYFIWAALILYFFSAMLLIKAFKYSDLSLLFPIIATGFVWVTLLARFIFQETISLTKWIGISFIFFGVIVLGNEKVKK